jgi:hypothetical protein
MKKYLIGVILVFCYIVSYYLIMNKECNPLTVKWGYLKFYPVYSENELANDVLWFIYLPLYKIDLKLNPNSWVENHPEMIPRQ